MKAIVHVGTGHHNHQLVSEQYSQPQDGWCREHCSVLKVILAECKEQESTQAQGRRRKKKRRNEDDDEDDYEERNGNRSNAPVRERTPTQSSRLANGAALGQAKSPYVDQEPLETGSDADEDARRAQVAAKNAAVAALLEPEEMGTFDDEVERVISHRYARHSRAPRKPLTVIRGGWRGCCREG